MILLRRKLRLPLQLTTLLFRGDESVRNRPQTLGDGSPGKTLAALAFRHFSTAAFARVIDKIRMVRCFGVMLGQDLQIGQDRTGEAIP